ncbi:MAG: quinolinate synthase NadA [Phycisphaerales bacterium JB040]
MLWQPSLPERYQKMTPQALNDAITARRQELGDRVVILGHHYQTDEVIRHADLIGDSLKLSQQAAGLVDERAREGRPPVEQIIFCGVHFMAETADMLSPESVSVILPDLSAGCSMADMAHHDDTEDAWDSIHETLGKLGWTGRIVPITYVNSSAAIKAFVGARGGACCTSSNADIVYDWAARGGETPAAPGEDIKVLFLPDQHLGRNTAASYGVDVGSQAVLYDPVRTRRGDLLGGIEPGDLLDSRVILWAGHCSVHKLFQPEHCDEIRRANEALGPGEQPMRILVHPECSKEVVDKSDLAGSTEYILRTIRDAPEGSRWAVGTEHNLVHRLSAEAAQRGVEVRILSDCQCLCTTMARIDQPHLLHVLDRLAEQPGKPTGNEIRVDAKTRDDALLSLNRMLELVAAPA